MDLSFNNISTLSNKVGGRVPKPMATTTTISCGSAFVEEEKHPMPMLPLPPPAKSLEELSPLPLTLPSTNPLHCCCNCNAPPKVSVSLSPDEVDGKGGSGSSSCRECGARQIVITEFAARTLQNRVAELENEMKEKHENEVGPIHSSQKVNSDHDREAPMTGAERKLATTPSCGRASVEEDQPPMLKLSPLSTPWEELSPPSQTSTILMPLLSSHPCHWCELQPEVSLYPNGSNNYGEEGGENSSCRQCQARHILLLKKATYTLEKRATKVINKKKEGNEADKLATKWREQNPLSLQEKESETAEEQHSMSVGSVNGVIVIHRNHGEEEEKEDAQQPLPSSAGKSEIHKAVKHRMRLMARAARYHGSIIANADRHQYSLGQLAWPSMMDVPSSEEDALTKATRLREGDGAWVKRRRRRSSSKSKGESNSNSWMYATVKERHEAHLVFTMNKRGSMKIFPMSSWAKFIRIVTQEDFNPTGDVHAANNILEEDGEEEIQHEDETDIMERTQALIESHPVMKRIMDMSRLKEGAEQQHLNNEDNPSSNVLTESILGRGSTKKIKEQGNQKITAIQDHEVSMYTLGEKSSTLKVLQDHDLPMYTLSDEDGALTASISFRDNAIMVKKKRKQKTARRSKSLPSTPPVLISSFVSLPMYCTDVDTDDEETNSTLNQSGLTLKHSNSRSHANNDSTPPRTK